MVKLSYVFRVETPVSPLWEYFSRFETIAEWDPNVLEAEVVQNKPQKIGTIYKLKTIWNGKVSTMNYTVTECIEGQKILLRGENKLVTADDQIHLRKISDNLTEVEYRADICLRGFYFLFTPLIWKGLDKLTEEAREGMIKKCEQKFGSTIKSSL